MNFRNAAIGVLAIFILVVSQASPSAALDRGKLQKFFSAPFSVGERDGSLPIWPVFKQTSSRDELVAYVFDYAAFEPAPNSQDERIDRLVAIRPSGEFLEVLVVGPEKPGLLDWLRRRPTFNFIRQDQAVQSASPDAPQNAVAFSRDYVRARLGLMTADKVHHSLELSK